MPSALEKPNTRRKLQLILRGAEWAICFMARGTLAGYDHPVLAWLREVDECFWCVVGEEQQIEDMPVAMRTNFFGDQFTFSIDEITVEGKIIQRLGGANNVSAARAAFNFYATEYPPHCRISLRQGSRPIAQAIDHRVME